MSGKLINIFVFFVMTAIPASLSAQNQTSDPEHAVREPIALEQQIQCERMVLNRENIHEFFENVAAVGRAKKTEWITFENYFEENLPRVNEALRNGPFGCDRFYLQVPLKWSYSAEREAVAFEGQRFWYKENLKLPDFSMATTEPLEKIGEAGIWERAIRPANAERDTSSEQTYSAGFDYVWQWSEVATTETNPTKIDRCALKLLSISADQPLRTLRHWCSTETQRWTVAFVDPSWRENGPKSSGFTFAAKHFSLPVEQAKRAREDGLYLYVGFRLAYDGYEAGEFEHQIHSTLEEVFIAGSEPDAPIFCSAQIPEPKKYVLYKFTNACIEGGKTAVVENIDWSPLPPKIQHWVSIYQDYRIGRDDKVTNRVWGRLRRRSDGILDTYAPHVHEAELARNNQIVVGPFVDADEARALAALLTDKKVDATAIEFRIEAPHRSVDHATFEVREYPREPSRYGPKITPFTQSE